MLLCFDNDVNKPRVAADEASLNLLWPVLQPPHGESSAALGVRGEHLWYTQVRSSHPLQRLQRRNLPWGDLGIEVWYVQGVMSIGHP